MTEHVILSDIHGNGLALDAVIEREGVGANYIVLGDLMGLNAMPMAVVTGLQRLENATILLGNHDRAIFYEHEGHVNSEALAAFEYEHNTSWLTDRQIKWLKRHQYMEEFSDGTDKIIATHAKPYPEKASGYERGNGGIRKGKVSWYASKLADDYDWVFHGHTHNQYDLDCSKFGHDIHFVNPGSLGYSGTYSIVDTDDNEVERRSVEWDHDRLIESINSKLPENAPIAEEWL